MRRLAAAAVALAVASVAHAESARVAVLLSNPIGDPDEEPLRYSDADAARVGAVLGELGGFAADDLIRVPRADLDGIAAGLREAVIRTTRYKSEGADVLFLVYYTGHAGTDGLHLAGQRMSFEALKAAARVVPADQRVFIVDSCLSGTLFRSKGARLVADIKARPATFEPPDDEAWISSSGPEEQALEIDRRRGSIFTHYLVSGSRGPADGDGDRQVRLQELFDFVRGQTSAEAARHGRLQQPRWAGQLGDIVLADLTRAQAALSFEGPVERPIVVARRDTETVVAEVPVGAGGFLALPPGPYQLLSGGGERIEAAELDLAEGHIEDIHPAERLESRRNLRTKGGLVLGHSWLVGIGYRGSVGAMPGASVGSAGYVSVGRELGRGHLLEVGAAFGRAAIDTSVLSGSVLRSGVTAGYAHTFGRRALRLRPAAGIELGVLQQSSARTPHPVWGSWYGDATQASRVQAPFAAFNARAELVLVRGDLEVQLAAGAGVQLRLDGSGATTPVGSWSLGVARRF